MAPDKSRLRRSISKWANSADQDARDLRKTYADSGVSTIAEAPDRERVRLRGTLRTVTCAASTSRKRSSTLPCLLMCPSRRRSPLDSSDGTSPR